ncbi:hypothetical protein GCM10009422_02180 [Brevundimonas kwangchunensis]|uniref:Uncharacterized protein n=1 Tax=Brevundimonas kwangchunensis TaxID=322163 RepID=A0ABN1GGE2_9CAUL
MPWLCSHFTRSPGLNDFSDIRSFLSLLLRLSEYAAYQFRIEKDGRLEKGQDPLVDEPVHFGLRQVLRSICPVHELPTQVGKPTFSLAAGGFFGAG